jgi:hypothetical protein
LCDRLAETLEADRMKFGVNLVMDFFPLLFLGLQPLGRGLWGRATFQWRRMAP